MSNLEAVYVLTNPAMPGPAMMGCAIGADAGELDAKHRSALTKVSP